MRVAPVRRAPEQRYRDERVARSDTDDARKAADAESYFRQAYDVFQKLEAEFPSARAHVGDFGAVCRSLGELNAAAGEFAKARSYYEQSVKHLRRRLEASPDYDTGRYALGMCLNGLGGALLRLGALVQAEESCREAIVELTKVPVDSRMIVHAARALLASHNLLIEILSKSGHPEKAEDVYRQVIELSTRLAAESPKQLEYQFQLSTAHHNFAVFMDGAKRPAEAEAEFRKALDVAEQAAAEFPETVKTWAQRRTSRALSRRAFDALEALCGCRTRLCQRRGCLREGSNASRFVSGRKTLLRRSHPSHPGRRHPGSESARGGGGSVPPSRRSLRDVAGRIASERRSAAAGQQRHQPVHFVLALAGQAARGGRCDPTSDCVLCSPLRGEARRSSLLPGTCRPPSRTGRGPPSTQPD